MSEATQTQTAVLLKAPGGPDQLVLGTAPKPTLAEKPDHILIRVHATAINRADTLQREGKYPAPKGESDILGLEAAGVVEELGGNVKNFKKGDRVMALLGGGGYAQYVAVHKGSVMPIPPDFSFEQAAAIPETWLTAFQLLHLVGEIQAGDYVLVHAGASGVGTAAIQLALLAGAKPIVTVSSAEKAEYCRNLGAIACINYKTTPQWADDVLAATEKNGVNVILDCIGESYAQLNSKTIALDGRWVLYGLMGGGVVPQFSFRDMLSKRVSLRATTLRTRSTDYKSALVQAFSDKALPHFAGGRFKVVVDEVFDAAAIGAAHAKMEKNANMGKIVVRMP